MRIMIMIIIIIHNSNKNNDNSSSSSNNNNNIYYYMPFALPCPPESLPGGRGGTGARRHLDVVPQVLNVVIHVEEVLEKERPS